MLGDSQGYVSEPQYTRSVRVGARDGKDIYLKSMTSSLDTSDSYKLSLRKFQICLFSMDSPRSDSRLSVSRPQNVHHAELRIKVTCHRFYVNADKVLYDAHFLKSSMLG